MSEIFDALLRVQRDVQSQRRMRNDGSQSPGHSRFRDLSPEGPNSRAWSSGLVATWLAKLGIGRHTQVPDESPSANASLLIAPDGSGDLAEPFRILRSSLLGMGGGRVMITSALDREGKSLCAANLAISLSLPRGSEVVLVDLDLRRPVQSDIFGLDDCPGVVDCLLGEASWSDCLQPTAYPNLKILTAGSHTRGAPELLASAALRAMMEDIRSFASTRFVLLDTPPVLLTADPRMLVDESDRVVLVVRAESTPKSAFVKAIEEMGSEKLLGVVFNQARQQASDYYHYGSAHYGRYYGTDKANP